MISGTGSLLLDLILQDCGIFKRAYGFFVYLTILHTTKKIGFPLRQVWRPVCSSTGRFFTFTYSIIIMTTIIFFPEQGY